MPAPKISQFRNRKQTFEEAISAGDVVKDSAAPDCKTHEDKDSRNGAGPAGRTGDAKAQKRDLDCSRHVLEEEAEEFSESLLPQEPAPGLSMFVNRCYSLALYICQQASAFIWTLPFIVALAWLTWQIDITMERVDIFPSAPFQTEPLVLPKTAGVRVSARVGTEQVGKAVFTTSLTQ